MSDQAQSQQGETHHYPGVIPHLRSRDAPAAIEFYKLAFAAEERARMPMEDGKRIMHCELVINGGTLMLADAMPEYGFAWTDPGTTVLNIINDDIRPWWNRAVDAGCDVLMPLELAFWGDLYGQAKDPFGHVWAFVGPPEKP